MERPGTAGARNRPGLSEAPGHSRHTSRSIGAITTSVVSSLVWNVAWGLAWGSLMAAIYCAIGLALRLVRGPHFLNGYGLPFGTLGLLYLEGGVGAGFVLGLFRPLLRWRAGAIGIGTFAGAIAYGAIAIAMSGPIGAVADIGRAIQEGGARHRVHVAAVARRRAGLPDADCTAPLSGDLGWLASPTLAAFASSPNPLATAPRSTPAPS